MNRFLLTIVVTCLSLIGFAQSFSGQWKGEFVDKSTKYMGWGGDKCEYVLDLESNGSKVTGFSYTYFSESGKRFYTICKLEGFIDKKNKYVEIKEIERTKTNVPVNIMNCFQVHKLTFFKTTEGDETLEGNWIPAPNQQGNCGFGVTTLNRRSLKKSFPDFKNPVAKINTKPVKTTPEPKSVKTPSPAKNSTTSTVTAKPPAAKPKATTVKATPILPKKDSAFKTQEIIKDPVVKNVPQNITSPGSKFEKRSNTILKTIEVENESIKIDLYDNGEIDGDSVSLFLNNKLILAHKKLTTQPLTVILPMSELNDSNELVMYADNLGTIPPNTAIMIVTDGKKRYEVRITSDLQKSGTIKFVKKQTAKQE